MSKVKLLINEVFKQGERNSGIKKKYPLALYLKVHLEAFKIYLDEKTFVRYYDAYVLEREKEMDPDPNTLNKLSHYLGYKDFAEFSNTFIKTDEEANFTKIKVSVDDNEISNLKEGFNINVIIKIFDKLDFPGKDLLMKNGLGILEMTFLFFLVTGGVVFSNNKNPRIGIMSGWGSPATDKPYMYWDKDRYMATDSSSLHSRVEVVPMSDFAFINMKKIMRPDTLNAENSMGKVWYDKSNHHVEFFTSFGKHPENEKTLKQVSEHILETYAGANAELEE